VATAFSRCFVAHALQRSIKTFDAWHTLKPSIAFTSALQMRVSYTQAEKAVVAFVAHAVLLTQRTVFDGRAPLRAAGIVLGQGFSTTTRAIAARQLLITFQGFTFRRCGVTVVR
jgi:hypothetical protein